MIIFAHRRYSSGCNRHLSHNTAGQSYGGCHPDGAGAPSPLSPPWETRNAAERSQYSAFRYKRCGG